MLIHQFKYADSLCHGDEAHIVFRVAAGLRVTNNINCILLSLESGGKKVSISHVLTVVHTKIQSIQILVDERSYEHNSKTNPYKTAF